MPAPERTASVRGLMANARAKKKAKSGSKVKSKKLVAKPKKAAKKALAKKAVAKKKPVAAKKASPAKKKPTAKKVVAAKKPAAVKRVPAAKPPELHPTVKSALEKADIEGLINRLPNPVQPIVKSLRALVLENAPEASEALEDGAPSYFANGLFARIVPEERAVLVKFLKAGQLPSSNELQGDTFAITELDEMKQNVLRKLVREAVLVNLRTEPTATA